MQLKSQVKENYLIATHHYVFNLKQKTVSRLLIFKNINIRRKIEFYKLQQSQNNRIIMKYFNKFILFRQNKKKKKNKMAMADNFYERFIMKQVFYIFVVYLMYRKNKRICLINMVTKIKKQLMQKKTCFLFQKWKHYYAYRICKRKKNLIAKNTSEHRVIKKCFNDWRNYWLYQKHKNAQIIQLNKLYELKMLKKRFFMWKCHIEDILLFTRKLKNANELYKHHMIEEGLLLIVRSGFLQKDKNFKKCKQIFSRNLFLACKYFSLWRRKTFKLCIENKHISLMDHFLWQPANFEWYTIFFLPRTF